MNLLLKKILGSAIRQALTALGAILVAKGVATPEVSDQFISSGADVLIGLISVFSSVGWSFFEKKVTSVKIAELKTDVKEERQDRALSNIAKGRAGSCPLSLVLFLAITSLLVGACTTSGPSACERELTACKLSLESALAK